MQNALHKYIAPETYLALEESAEYNETDDNLKLSKLKLQIPIKAIYDRVQF